MFTLFDMRNWYIIASDRDSTPKRIAIGNEVHVYLEGQPERRFSVTAAMTIVVVR